MHKQIVVLPGDGIGEEVTKAAKRVVQAVAERYGHTITFSEKQIGGTAYDHYGTPLPDETVNACQEADAVLLGAVGGPKWDHLPSQHRPEKGLLGIRKSLGLFANLRPITAFDQLIHATSLKEEVIQGTDLLIVRELTGGLYFGEPSERRDEGNTVVDTLVYKRYEIDRILEQAFQAARGRRKKLTSVDKANVLESSKLWREMVDEKAKDYPDVEVEHVLVDAAAMKLIQNPRDFDVIVTENLFGDILSDEASVMTGSLGMLPSASLGESGVDLYEPVHGSAPDIAGKNQANPLAAILSVAMMFRHSFQLETEAHAIEMAVFDALNAGYHTSDLRVENGHQLGTKEMTDRVIDGLTLNDATAGILFTYA